MVAASAAIVAQPATASLSLATAANRRAVARAVSSAATLTAKYHAIFAVTVAKAGIGECVAARAVAGNGAASTVATRGTAAAIRRQAPP